VVFDDISKSQAADPELYEMGKEAHENDCIACHSSPKSAFVSLPLAKLLKPLALLLNKTRADLWLYYLHVISCFIGLAYLPFGKFFHIISDPVSLLASGVTSKEKQFPENAATRRAMELDACTNCGTCSEHCSVAPVFRMMGNNKILPAQKIESLKKIAGGKELSTKEMQTIAEGAFICSSCYRCTEVCPTGINLQDQWVASGAELKAKGFSLPHKWIKETAPSEWAETPQDIIPAIAGGKRNINLTDRTDTFFMCIQCQTCNNVCPVLACNGEGAVDITPQKIMNLLRMGLRDIAMGTRMVWDCTTCYQCQENCPQGIPVTDIIYELKNRAYGKLRKAK